MLRNSVCNPFLMLFGLILGLSVLTTAPAQADEAYLNDAKAFIATLSTDAMASIAAKGISKEQRVANFTALFEEHFAVKSIGKWVLGRYWRRASEAEQEEYFGLFKELMIATYVDRFATYSGDGVSVIKAIQERENSATVFSEIALPGSEKPVRVDWRLGSKDGTFKIVDIVVEGTSMSTTLRSDFSSIIKREGGEVAGLLKALREKTEELKAETAG